MADGVRCLGSQSKHQNETKSETNMVFAPVLFLRNKLRPAPERFPVSRNETEVQIARFVSMSSLNPCFCIVPWAPYGKALIRGGVVLRDLKKGQLEIWLTLDVNQPFLLDLL